MRQILTSPFPSGGRNPVAEAVSPDQADLYVVNRDDNSIVQFIDRQRRQALSAEHREYAGHLPARRRRLRNFLFVVDTYQPLPTCIPASPCSGSVAVFPILTAAQAGALKPSQPANTLGTPVVNAGISASYWPLLLTGGSRLGCFRSHRRSHGCLRRLCLRRGIRFQHQRSAMSSDLPPAPTARSPRIPGFPVPVGTHPSAIASDSTGAYLYVTDSIQNVVYGFQINGGA